MTEISHFAEAWTSLSWPKTIAFCFHVKAAEVAAEVTALQFLFFAFLCMYTTILDLGYINFVARDTTGDCAWKIISGVDATISLHFIGDVVNSKGAKLHYIFPEPSSARVSVATLTALARRSLNIEILRDPAKGKCISSIPRRVEFIFKCRGHFEQLSDADAKKLSWSVQLFLASR